MAQSQTASLSAWSGRDASHETSRVAVLLSTFNGAAFLREQIESLLDQTHQNWMLYWRDDGSTDATIAILDDFTARAGEGRCVRIGEGEGRVGPTQSYLALVKAVFAGLGPRDVIAFADQDDVWLPDKLSRGLAALAGEPDWATVPILYCARQVLVDVNLREIGFSGGLARWTGFPAALTQNIATGCTMLLNRPAAALAAGSRAPSSTLHDWWCYLIVTASGGKVVQDQQPVVLYRQHPGNLVGAPRSMADRAVAALRRGPGVFMGVLRNHVAALSSQPELMTDTARKEVADLARALDGGTMRRLRALRTPGLYRQTWPETLLFRWWFLIG